LCGNVGRRIVLRGCSSKYDPGSPAPCSSASFNIAWCIAYHPARREIERVITSGLLQQARFGLPAQAVLSDVVGTEIDAVNHGTVMNKSFFHPGMNVFKILELDLAKGDAPLIRNDENLESCLRKLKNG
jgi:hypothetical protein